MRTVDLHLTEAEKDSILKGRGYVLKDTPYGRAGDTFAVDGKRFEIIDVNERSLNRLSRQCDSIIECGALSSYISERKTQNSTPDDPGTSIFIHWFRQI